MEIKEIINQKVWQEFFDKAGSPSFLPSFQWGEFQKSLNYGVVRLGLYSNRKLNAIAQVIKIKSRRGNFLFIPHGPLIKIKNQTSKIKNYIEKIKNYLIWIARNENFDFIRVAPVLENTSKNQKIFKDLGFKTAPIYMHAETIWLLPLNQSEEELLKQMRKTTRYLIKKAQREHVVVEIRTDKKAVDDFYRIYQETAKREKFIPFSKDFIQKEFDAFQKTGDVIFLFGKIKNALNNQPPTINQILASALILFTKSTAFYHQGASLHTKIPVSYLLQWEAIREAKRRGCRFYNFWGIYDEKSGRTPKSWQGLTLFKTGFGGHAIRYLPTQDYILTPKYYLTYLWEKILNWKRRI